MMEKTMLDADKKFLEYVRNTAGNATVAHFDDDWEPIGPRVRAKLMPSFFIENAGGKLELTPSGRRALAEANGGRDE